MAYVPQAHTPPFPFEVLEVVGLERIATLGLSRGVILSTHDPDQSLAMSDGRMPASGPAAEVPTPVQLARICGVPLRVEVTPSGRRVRVPAIAAGCATTWSD